MFERLIDRLRRIVPRGQGYAPVMLARAASATEQGTSARGWRERTAGRAMQLRKSNRPTQPRQASAERDQRSGR